MALGKFSLLHCTVARLLGADTGNFFPCCRKTTLMDVIALRKQSGTIKGKVCLNGWPQDTISFRRCSGYVEQFDVQTPELTVQESVLFSAKLRLDPALIKTDADVNSFVDQVMEAVELAPLAGVLVGTDETFGLSFEQKKRLSIAIELAASPSILFLDEPVSLYHSNFSNSWHSLLIVYALFVSSSDLWARLEKRYDNCACSTENRGRWTYYLCNDSPTFIICLRNV